jgi:hypothetical protein
LARTALKGIVRLLGQRRPGFNRAARPFAPVQAEQRPQATQTDFNVFMVKPLPPWQGAA